MLFWKSIEGQYRIEITGGDLSQTLTAIQRSNIFLTDICYVDALHLQATVSRFQMKQLIGLLNKRGEDLRLIRRMGIYWIVLQMKCRPVLLAGLLLILFLCVFIPTRVMFVQVEGNETVPTRRIVEASKNFGLRFMASRRSVQSEKLKNALLNALPELQWAGVNTKGCVAVISVKERAEEPNKDIVPLVGNIVSRRDGIIQEITVLSGTPICKVGQGVRKGQVLISGYTDCGLLIKAQMAEGEVIGQTFREIEAVTPVEFDRREEQTRKSTRIMLRVGKNIINFCKDSGISDALCVKMYEEKFLTLPGGFVLPLALITETTIYTEFDGEKYQSSDLGWMKDACEGYLKSDMISGEILSDKQWTEIRDSVYVFKGKYTCREMLGKMLCEEIINNYGT